MFKALYLFQIGDFFKNKKTIKKCMGQERELSTASIIMKSHLDFISSPSAAL